MSNTALKTRADRSATAPTAPAPTEEKKQRQARQDAISHRQNASHHFAMHRSQAREGAHQLGSEFASFLKPKSATPSATHSRSASRHPSGEKTSTETSQARPRQRKMELKKAPPVTWDDVRELRRLREESEQRLRCDLDDLSAFALSGSRQVDGTLHGIQSDMKSASLELDVLRDLSQLTRDSLSRFKDETEPSVVHEHEKQLSTLHDTYDSIEKNRIGDLERRLKKAKDSTTALSARMQAVRQDVAEWEIRDKEDLKRSNRRHWVFWSILLLFTALFVIIFFPRSGQRLAEKMLTATQDLNQTDIGDERLRRPPRVAEEDARFKIFDEL